MLEGPALRNLTDAIADACRSGLDPDALRVAVLPRLRRVVPVDALWWALVDPATLLFTRAHRDNLPEEIGPYFVENELLADDANKWTDLARTPIRRSHTCRGDGRRARPQCALSRHLQAARAVGRAPCRAAHARHLLGVPLPPS